MSFEKVLKAALALPPNEQRGLIGRVYAHLQATDEAGVGPEWLAEIQRRSDEIDAGTAKLMSAAELKRRMDKLSQSVRVKR